MAVAPAIYQRQVPKFETGYTPEDVEIGRVYKNQTVAEELISDHGFFCDRRSSYNEEAATDAWQKVLELFSQELNSKYTNNFV